MQWCGSKHSQMGRKNRGKTYVKLSPPESENLWQWSYSVGLLSKRWKIYTSTLTALLKWKYPRGHGWRAEMLDIKEWVETGFHISGNVGARGSQQPNDLLSMVQPYINYEETLLVDDGERGWGAGTFGPNHALERDKEITGLDPWNYVLQMERWQA